MLQSRPFMDRVLRKPAFSKRVLSLVVDEGHCVSHWGASFRKAYSTLGIVRAFLPRGTPVVVVTATLTTRVKYDLHRVLHIPKLPAHFLNLGNERSNVSLVVRALEHPQNTYLDLNFVIPPTVHTPYDIPKTYIYVDDINLGGEIVLHLNTVISSIAPTLATAALVRPYNSSMSADYRLAAMDAFRHTAPEPGATHTGSPPSATPKDKSCIRILVCTDAAGMVRVKPA